MHALCSGHMAIVQLAYMSNNLVEDISFRLTTRVNYCWNIMPTNGNIYIYKNYSHSKSWDYIYLGHTE